MYCPGKVYYISMTRANNYINSVPGKLRLAIKLIVRGDLNKLIDKSKEYLRIYGYLEVEKLDRRVDVLDYKMTTMGYPDQAMSELEQIASNPLYRPYIRAKAAWFIITRRLLNSYSPTDIIAGLRYIPIIRRSKTFSVYRSQRLRICEINGLTRIGMQSKATSKINKILRSDATYADAYLAKANISENKNDKLNSINEMLSVYGVSPISFTNGDSPNLFDQLGYIPDKSFRIYKDGPLVSVIMPAYNCESTISMSLNSVLNQTWRNLEVIVVDDHSSDGTVDVVKQYMKEDERLSLIESDKNNGAYVSRNKALKKATGDFVTVFDSDDWSHPEKTALQVLDLLANPKAIGNMSYLSRVTEDLVFIRKGSPGVFTQPNTSSLMLRRERLLNTFGYWDSVRFAADSELFFRIKRKLGQDSIRELPEFPLSFARQSDKSLTGSGPFGLEGFPKGARNIYRELYNLYQQEVGDMKYSFPMENRPFYAPRPMRPNYKSKEIPTYDLVFIGDFRDINNPICKHALLEIMNNKNRRIGLVQRCEYETSIKQDTAADIRRSLQANKIEMVVFGETVNARLAIIDPISINPTQLYIPDLIVKNTVKMVYGHRLPTKQSFEVCDSMYPAMKSNIYFYDEDAKRKYKEKILSYEYNPSCVPWTKNNGSESLVDIDAIL